jgi:hypothetical protein
LGHFFAPFFKQKGQRVTRKQRLTSKRLGCSGSFRPHAGQRSAITDSIPLESQNRPASARNTVRHHTGMLSAIIPESVSGMVRITHVAAFNPYWDRDGVTFEDPDGYRIVLQNAAWSP